MGGVVMRPIRPHWLFSLILSLSIPLPGLQSLSKDLAESRGFASYLGEYAELVSHSSIAAGAAGTGAGAGSGGSSRPAAPVTKEEVLHKLRMQHALGDRRAHATIDLAASSSGSGSSGRLFAPTLPSSSSATSGLSNSFSATSALAASAAADRAARLYPGAVFGGGSVLSAADSLRGGYLHFPSSTTAISAANALTHGRAVGGDPLARSQGAHSAASSTVAAQLAELQLRQSATSAAAAATAAAAGRLGTASAWLGHSAAFPTPFPESAASLGPGIDAGTVPFGCIYPVRAHEAVANALSGSQLLVSGGGEGDSIDVNAVDIDALLAACAYAAELPSLATLTGRFGGGGSVDAGGEGAAARRRAVEAHVQAALAVMERLRRAGSGFASLDALVTGVRLLRQA